MMKDINEAEEVQIATPSPSSKAARRGAAIGAAIPVGFGIWMMVWNAAYEAALPKAPHLASCGMPALGALAMIVFGGPIGGILGAGIGTVLTWIRQPPARP